MSTKLEIRNKIEDLVIPHRDKLRKIKRLTRADEMDLDRALTDRGAVLQFNKDTHLYNLFEACLMSWQYAGSPVNAVNNILLNHNIK